MWQHALNIIIGILLVTGTFIATSAGLINSQLLWWFSGAGIAIVVFSCWGLFDELVYESQQNRDDSNYL